MLSFDINRDINRQINYLGETFYSKEFKKSTFRSPDIYTKIAKSASRSKLDKQHFSSLGKCESPIEDKNRETNAEIQRILVEQTTTLFQNKRAFQKKQKKIDQLLNGM